MKVFLVFVLSLNQHVDLFLCPIFALSLEHCASQQSRPASWPDVASVTPLKPPAHVGARWEPEQPLIPTVRDSASAPPVKLPKLQLLPWPLQALRDRLHAARFINYSPQNSALPRCRSNPPLLSLLYCKQLPQFYYLVCAHAGEVSNLEADFFKGGLKKKAASCYRSARGAFFFYAPESGAATRRFAARSSHQL